MKKQMIPNTTSLSKKLHKNIQIKLMVIGHRGVGKTSFLKHLTPFLKKQGIVVFHLDMEVEKQNQKSIKKIFEEKGESFFRELEIHCFFSLIEKHKDKNLVIDTGGGFLGKKPRNFKALWLQRTVDLSKAFFPDRPKLDNPHEINTKRFQQRQRHYQSMADYALELPEDKFGDKIPLKKFFEKSILKIEDYSFEGLWFLTRLHANHNTTIRPSQTKNSLGWELRNDLLSFSTIQKLLKKYPESLISFRKKEESKKLETLLKNDSLWDWPLEWGFNREAKILSLHKKQNSLKQTLNQLPSGDQIIKLAIPIKDFNELKLGYQWFLENPEKRVFLPTSSKGRWKWFRLLTACKMPFGFFREAGGIIQDQPTLMDLLNHHPHWPSFAAILGSPVNHSLTPCFHRQFFTKKQINCLAIDLLKEEWEQAFPFLDKMGLKAAAITSPLKKKAAEWIGQKSSTVNTLFKKKNNWFGTSTDQTGFKKLISGYENKKVVVWGGGDLLNLIKKSFPKAVSYSSRTGQPKDKNQSMKPDILIWAVGPENFRKKGVYPPRNWKPEKVIDLNYNIDSPGLVCAHNYGCHYQSGLAMFTEQAKEQQRFWNQIPK